MCWNEIADILGKIIAPLSGAIAAVAALLTVRHLRATRREQIESNRSYFTIVNPGIKPLPQSPPYRIQITMENVGVRPAYDLLGKIYIIDKNLRSGPRITIDFSVANEIVAKTPTPWYSDNVQILGDVPPQYIVLAIKYSDPITRESFAQTFFMKWDGVANGQTHPDFVHASIEEKQNIADHLSDLLRDFM
jgi:hypothetical protein